MFTCPCCGYKTLPTQRAYDICPICFCFWEDDLVQWIETEYAGGANRLSLQQSQRNFLIHGASERRFLQHVRTATPMDKRDLRWRPVSSAERVRYLYTRFLNKEFELEEFIYRLEAEAPPDELEPFYERTLYKLEDIRWTSGKQDAIECASDFLQVMNQMYPEYV